MHTVKKELHLALIGYGRMGKAIENLALSRGHTIRAIIDNEDDWPAALPKLATCDVAFEFTQPEAAPANISRCFNAGVPVVTGTTGWNHDLPAITRLCKEKNGTLFHASNFCIGVNVFFEINQRLATILSEMKAYKVRIMETHHTQKLDAPSGTAITLAEDIIASRSDMSRWVSADQALTEGTLPIKSFRIEHVTGTHVVTYESPIDTIEIKHTAHDRKGFAEGAVLAAEWVVDKQGVFTMKTMLNL